MLSENIFAEDRGLVGFGPGHFGAGLVMREIVEPSLKPKSPPLLLKRRMSRKGSRIGGLAVGCETHHFCIRRRISGSRDICVTAL